MAWIQQRSTKSERDGKTRSSFSEDWYTYIPCTDVGTEGSGGWSAITWTIGAAHGTQTGYYLQDYALDPRPKGLAGFALARLFYAKRPTYTPGP